ncbi:MAG TPA: chemotaxis protein CheB [Xanthobacteraceae bacterium]
MGNLQTASRLIVAIGASAGGIHALQAFFTALPEHTGAAFVVVIHLDSQHRSETPSMLVVNCSNGSDALATAGGTSCGHLSAPHHETDRDNCRTGASGKRYPIGPRSFSPIRVHPGTPHCAQGPPPKRITGWSGASGSRLSLWLVELREHLLLARFGEKADIDHRCAIRRSRT